LSGALNIPIPTKAEYFSILLFERGSGFVRIDEEVHEISQGKIIVVFPNQLGCCNLSEDTAAHHLIATKEVYEAITSLANLSVRKLKPVSGFDVNEVNFEILLQEFAAIRQLLENYRPEEGDIVLNRFKTIYLIHEAACMKIRKYDISEINHPVTSKIYKTH